MTAAGTLHLFYREIALDERLHDQQVTCYETFDGLEVRSADQQVYLWREYVTWKHRYWRGKGRALPMDLRFESLGQVPSPCIAVAQ